MKIVRLVCAALFVVAPLQAAPEQLRPSSLMTTLYRRVLAKADVRNG